ncbi:hypothetical protein [Amycolatopsis tolypomycina]|uniref:hypothetical protein n=1 Tax=Amycolatopsis tolypomycina TaxID=208445 RepID=UPI0033AAF5DD
MVANQPVERPDSMDFLVNRIRQLEQKVAELTAQSKFPFSVSHGSTRDFSVLPSNSGDGSADLYMGNGAGGSLLEVYTDSTYHRKIATLRDMSGRIMLSTDAATGYGLGNPTLPYPYDGQEQIDLTGATSPGSAVEIGSGSNWPYNPALWVTPRVRTFSAANATVKMFAVFTAAGGTYTTGERTINITGGVVSISRPEFATYLAAGDIAAAVNVSFKVYCSAGTASGVTAQMWFWRGMGVSKGFVDQTLQGAL